MKSFWNFLKKNKLYGAINLVGLTVSMAFVLLLAVYVQRQLSTDTFQENADRIYVIANEDNVTMGYWLDKHLKNNFPEIEKGCCVANMSSAAAFSIDGERVYGSTMAADSTFFEIFIRSYDLDLCCVRLSLDGKSYTSTPYIALQVLFSRIVN